ncbi:hypothetical protein [Kamptonema formosum]|nr:hypothetical protein [Oscillatoria sp. PCC 10802]
MPAFESAGVRGCGVSGFGCCLPPPARLSHRPAIAWWSEPPP